MSGTLNRNTQLLTVSRAGTTGVLGPIGVLNRSTEGLSRVFYAASGPGRTMQPFTRSFYAVVDPARTLEPFTRSFAGVMGGTVLGFDRQLKWFNRVLTAQPPPGDLARQMRFFTREGEGLTGAVGDLTRETALLLRVFDGYSPAVGQTARVLQFFQRVMSGSTAVTGPVVFSMNIGRQALTTYENYAFNSFAKYNGKFLGASDAGVFILTGADDDGTAINAVFRTGMTDFDTSYQKRASRLYLGYRADGDVTTRVITDETDVHGYLLHATSNAGLHGAHVPVGKGIKARYWQFELQNVAGSDFELDSLEVKPIVLRRRIGDMDA